MRPNIPPRDISCSGFRKDTSTNMNMSKPRDSKIQNNLK